MPTTGTLTNDDTDAVTSSHLAHTVDVLKQWTLLRAAIDGLKRTTDGATANGEGPSGGLPSPR